MREGEAAFGDATVFIEQAVVEPRHIEVQVLADAAGEIVIHLYERDCSVQRRHQKVIEIAPAPNLDPDLRDRHVRRRRVVRAGAIGYVNAGTVEFLLDAGERPTRVHRDEPADPGRAHGHRGGHRRRPGAVAQLRSRPVRRCADLGLTQDQVKLPRRGAAVPVTTEDPANGFRPDTGMITNYRSPGGAGRPPRRRHRSHRRVEVSGALRLDAGEADLPRRGLPERRGAGPGGRSRSSGSAGCPPTSRSCRPCSPTPTSRRRRDHVVHRRPARSCCRRPPSADRGSKMLSLPGRRHRQQAARPAAPVTSSSRPTSSRLDDLGADAPDGSRQLLRSTLGPGGFARQLREQTVPWRSPTPRSATPTSRLLATRVRTRDLLAVAPYVARTTPQLLSRWSAGAAPRTTSRCGSWPRTRGSGWPRCARRCRTCACRCCCAGATPSATPRTRLGGDRRVRRGGRRHRDRHLPDLRRAERRRADAPGDRRRPRDRHGRRRGGALLHRRPVRPRRERSTRSTTTCAWPTDRRGRRARPGDQGHGRPAAAPGRRAPWSPALRDRFDLPVHLHTHDTAGRPARHPARGDRRRGGRGRRGHRLDGRHHQPAAAVRAGRGHRPHRARDTGPGRCAR